MIQEKVLSKDDWWDSLPIDDKFLIASDCPRDDEFEKKKNMEYEKYLIKAKLDML